MLKKLLHINMVCFKKCLENNEVRIRLYRKRDLYDIYFLFNLESSKRALDIDSGTFTSLSSFKRWLKATFRIVYLIECQKRTNHRIIGFVGLYDIKMDGSLWLSIGIFHSKDRKHGYGQNALKLLLEFLKDVSAISEVYVSIHKNNPQSLGFFTRMGFNISEEQENEFILYKNTC